MQKISKSLFLALCVCALPQLARAQDRGQPQSNGRPAPEQTPPPAPAPAPAPAVAPAPTSVKRHPTAAPAAKQTPAGERHAPAAQGQPAEKQAERTPSEPVVDRRTTPAQRPPQAAGQAQGQEQGQTQQQQEQRIHNAREQQKQEEQRAQAAREQQKQQEEQRIHNARAQQKQEEQRTQNARADAKGGADDVKGQPPETVFRKFKLEEAKHRERTARIAALRRLANARQNQEQVAQLDRLLEKENQQYGEWIRRTRSALGPEEFEAQRARLDGRAVRKQEGAAQKRPAEQAPPPTRPQ